MENALSGIVIFMVKIVKNINLKERWFLKPLFFLLSQKLRQCQLNEPNLNIHLSATHQLSKNHYLNSQ